MCLLSLSHVWIIYFILTNKSVHEASPFTPWEAASFSLLRQSWRSALSTGGRKAWPRKFPRVLQCSIFALVHKCYSCPWYLLWRIMTSHVCSSNGGLLRKLDSDTDDPFLQEYVLILIKKNPLSQGVCISPKCMCLCSTVLIRVSQTMVFRKHLSKSSRKILERNIHCSPASWF